MFGADVNGQFYSQLPFSSVSKRVLFQNVSHDNEFDLHYEYEHAREHIFRDRLLFLPAFYSMDSMNGSSTSIVKIQLKRKKLMNN